MSDSKVYEFSMGYYDGGDGVTWYEHSRCDGTHADLEAIYDDIVEETEDDAIFARYVNSDDTLGHTVGCGCSDCPATY